MFAIFWISKKLAISSVVGTGNRNFNPILVITTLWTLLSPTIVRMQAVLQQYTFCCLSSAALPSQIPHEDNRCARNTQQCAGRSTFCAFLGDSGCLVRKPLMWEKNSCITVLWQKSHWFPVCSRNQLKLLAEDLHLIWNRSFSRKDKRQGQRGNMQGLSCDLVASSKHVLCKALLLSSPLLD